MSDDFPQVGVEAIVEGLQDFLKATKAIEKALGNVEEAEKDVEKQSESLSKQIEKFGQRSQKAFLGMTAAGVAIGGTLVKLASDAAPLQGVADSFDAIAASAGLSLSSLQEAAAGTVADIELMRQANIALTGAGKELGTQFGQSLPRLLEVARASARATGQDVGFLFNSLVTGIKRTSPMLIDNTGLQLKLGEANQALADQLGKTTEELTGEEKQIALLNATVEAGGRLIDSFGGIQRSAAEDAASLQAEISNLKTGIGTLLVPALSEAVSGMTSLVSAVNELPDPTKQTIVEIAGATSGILAIAGAAGLAIPKIVGMVNALRGLSIVQAVGLGPLGIGAAAVGAIAAAAIHLNNLEEAHKQEAAAVLASSETYDDYVKNVENAELASFELSEGLFEIVKAADAARQEILALEFQEAQRQMEGFLDRIFTGVRDIQDLENQTQLFSEALANNTDAFSDHQLIVLEDEQTVKNFFLEMGTGVTQAENLTRAVIEQASETRRHRQGLESLTRMEDARADATRQSTKATEDQTGAEQKLIPVQELLNKRIEDMAVTSQRAAEAQGVVKSALEEVLKTYESFSGTLASGINDLRNLDQAAIDSAENYEQSLKDLASSANQSYGSIREKYEDSLPDFTTVSERMGMQEDAWDEWRLRFQDILQNGITEPWLQELEMMGMTKPPDVGITEWIEGLLEKFEAGDLQQLINEDAKVWQDHAQKVAEAQQKESAAVAKATAEKRRQIEEARQEEIRLAQEARERSLLELSLQLAQESGLLQQWAQQRFGAFAGAADSATEVLSLLDSGLLTVDSTLEQIITNTAAGVTTALDMTGGQAEATKTQLSDTLNEAILLSQQFQTETANLDAQIQASQGLEGLLPPEDAAMLQENIGTVKDELDTIKSEFVDGDPFIGMALGFEGATDAMVEDAADMVEGVDSAFLAIGTTAEEVFSAIIEGWTGNSVIPYMIEGANDLEGAWDGMADDMENRFIRMTDRLADDFYRKRLRIVNNINKIIAALEKIPTRIEIEILVKNRGGAATGGTTDTTTEGTTEGTVTGDAIKFASNFGVMLGEALVNSVSDGLEELFKIGGELSGLARGFSSAFEDQAITPLENRLEQIDLDIETARAEGNLFELASLQAERLQITKDFADQQQKILDLQEKQAQLKFLEQQFKLLELIEDRGLDASLLQGIQFGVDADAGALVDAMSSALQAIIDATNQQLVTGATVGASSALLAPMVQAPVPTGEGAFRASGAGMNSQTFNFGNNTINDRMEFSAFEANVLRILRSEVRRG